MYEETTGRTLLQKILLILLAAMAVLFAVLTVVFRSQPRVEWADSLLRPAQTENTAVYTGASHGQDVSVRVYPDGADTVVDFAIGSLRRHTGRVTWPEGTISREYGGAVPRVKIFLDDAVVFSGGYDKSSGLLYHKDGSWEPGLSIGTNTSYSSYWSSYQLDAFDILYFALGPETVHRGSWAIWAVTLFISLLAAVDIAFPLAFFYFRYSFSVQNPEPSDFYLSMQKVGWVIGTVVILGMYIWGLTMVS